MMTPLLVAVLALGAPEVDPLLARLRPGMSADEAKRISAALGLDAVKWRKAAEPQALAEGLVKTKLLETLNRFKAAPADATGGLDAGAFKDLMSAKKGGRSYAAAFGDKGLRFLLARIPVPVDPAKDGEPGAAPDRLHRLKEALKELGPLTPKPPDRWGNTYEWTGKGVDAVYLPEEDELRVLIRATDPGPRGS